ncbi:hypothetical protein FRC18_000579, partial [Serendipita sp. 400]
MEDNASAIAGGDAITLSFVPSHFMPSEAHDNNGNKSCANGSIAMDDAAFSN